MVVKSGGLVKVVADEAQRYRLKAVHILIVAVRSSRLCAVTSGSARGFMTHFKP